MIAIYDPVLFMSFGNRSELSNPFIATWIIDKPIFVVSVTEFGLNTLINGSIQPKRFNAMRVALAFGATPRFGIIAPGRNMYACLNPSLSKSFSVFPFTRAHIWRPFSVLSVPIPDT